jgi:PPOX class probable F420-dependent enzyme
MSDEELRDFLEEQRIVSCATVGPKGRPHLVPLWYVPNGVEMSGWTYGKSQKAKNLERDPHATLQVEDGVQYHELRGVMMECDVELEHDSERVGEFGIALFERYAGGRLDDDARAAVLAQAPKRVGLRFVPTRIVSWDHRKLGGTY